ncbi:PIN domain-containing protein [Fulvimonas soli]|jgi:predicted nucleic acid-binding protein|uniref:Putative nucleic acid-binding protein n=1 Tax=Fulvimonas soli TaxID=155197 RepID=A0A316HWK1_9GAMM|nr:PIN domain-containing protein [Fulvimonas soli]PWK85836.1 putative nucleic acid-binding protein [Fulvimonas soli]TNY27258.1 toxin [Fulvimonas soli]
MPSRLVLDTNVCLDLFVFADARCAALLEALRAGRAEAVTRADCRDEWLAVLRYPQLALDEARRARAAAAFDAHVRCLPAGGLPACEGAALPRCADPDDQKFLELAWQSRAAWLLSKDRALLGLARRAQRAGLFRIGMPQQWTPS